MDELKLELTDGKLPWMPLFIKDIMTDENVTLMDNQDFGCYMKLLMHQWIEHSIPADLSKIARLCREDANAMQTHWERIAPCFVDVPGEPGRLRNEKLRSIYEAAMAKVTKKKTDGKTAADARWGKQRSPKQQEMQTQSERNANALPTQCNKESESDTELLHHQKERNAPPPTSPPANNDLLAQVEDYLRGRTEQTLLSGKPYADVQRWLELDSIDLPTIWEGVDAGLTQYQKENPDRLPHDARFYSGWVYKAWDRKRGGVNHGRSNTGSTGTTAGEAPGTGPGRNGANPDAAKSGGNTQRSDKYAAVTL